MIRGWTILAAALLLGGGALLYLGVARTLQVPSMQVPCVNPVAGCLLLEQGLRIRFDRRPQPMRPFRLRVEVASARALHASFAMRDMQMGLNRYRLLADGDGAWTGEIILPVCVHGRSDWIMTLDVDGRLYQLPFSSG
ncbi:hypothetical protein GALL_380030 [mine drainage metagenome]|uniref:Uncharacterized protein n=1 Tax=mine drainage metagenome TaxID=410659 RepID=A0A1J5Q9E2_9ZZZZ